MNNRNRFLIGAFGSLLPVLVSFLSVDIAAIVDHPDQLTAGIYVGAAIKYGILFVLGGSIAALNREDNPVKLVQLGIAAPALVASYMNSEAHSAPAAETKPVAFHFEPFISTAHAAEPGQAILQQASFFGDILKGVSRPLNSIVAEPQGVTAAPPSPATTDIENAQRYLLALGYRNEPPNGQLDAATVSQLAKFRQEHNLPPAAAVDAPLLARLKTTLVNRPDPR